MRSLKAVGMVIIALIVVILGLGLLAPRKYQVEEAITISAPEPLVFDYVRYWHNWHKWSPWIDMDSTLSYTVEGEDGEVGAVYKWTGDPDLTGEGEMTLTGVKEMEEITFEVHFLEPMEGISQGYIRLEESDEGVVAKWGSSGSTKFPWNIVMLLVSAEKMMGGDFERGLKLLKDIAEQDAAKIAKFEVKEIGFPTTTYAAIRGKVAFDDMQSFLGEAFSALAMTLAEERVKIIGPPVGLYFSWDEQTMITDMAAGFPVRKNVVSDKVQMIGVPAGKGYKVEYCGPYNELMYAHCALDYYIRGKGKLPDSMVIEEYITNPQTEPDSSKWLTNIYYFAR